MNNPYKVELTDETVQELVRRIRAVVPASKIIIFGSAARDLMAYDSDIDVLVVVPDGTHRLETCQRIHLNLFGFGKPVDVVVATVSDLERHGNTPGYIYQTALEEGRTVYAA